jgi:hypothetical protein
MDEVGREVMSRQDNDALVARVFFSFVAYFSMGRSISFYFRFYFYFILQD